jgi:hypothetical protein
LILFRAASGWSSCDITCAYMRLPLSSDDQAYLCIHWRECYWTWTSLPMGIAPSASHLMADVDKVLQVWQAKSRFLLPNAQLAPAPYMDDVTTLIFLDWSLGRATIEEENPVRRNLET